MQKMLKRKLFKIIFGSIALNLMLLSSVACSTSQILTEENPIDSSSTIPYYPLFDSDEVVNIKKLILDEQLKFAGFITTRTKQTIDYYLVNEKFDSKKIAVDNEIPQPANNIMHEFTVLNYIKSTKEAIIKVDITYIGCPYYTGQAQFILKNYFPPTAPIWGASLANVLNITEENKLKSARSIKSTTLEIFDRTRRITNNDNNFEYKIPNDYDVIFKPIYYLEDRIQGEFSISNKKDPADSWKSQGDYYLIIASDTQIENRAINEYKKFLDEKFSPKLKSTNPNLLVIGNTYDAIGMEFFLDDNSKILWRNNLVDNSNFPLYKIEFIVLKDDKVKKVIVMGIFILYDNGHNPGELKEHQHDNVFEIEY